MGPRPSFQYQRARSRLGHSRQSLAPTLPPTPLQNITNESSLPPQPVLQKSPHPSKRLSIAEPPSKKKPRQNKNKSYSSLYKRIQTGVPDEQRLKILLESVMLEEYESKYANTNTAEREEFEGAMLKVLDFLETLVADAHKSDELMAGKRKPNPMNAELEMRAVQLEEIIKNYQIELEKWDSVEEQSTKPVEIPTVTEAPHAEQLAQCPDPAELVKTSAEAIETYVLQADHLSTILRKLESRNRVTHSRVQAIAAALNDRVMSELGKKSHEGGLTPPPNLASIKVTNLDM